MGARQKFGIGICSISSTPLYTYEFSPGVSDENCTEKFLPRTPTLCFPRTRVSGYASGEGCAAASASRGKTCCPKATSCPSGAQAQSAFRLKETVRANSGSACPASSAARRRASMCSASPSGQGQSRCSCGGTEMHSCFLQTSAPSESRTASARKAEVSVKRKRFFTVKPLSVKVTLMQR